MHSRSRLNLDLWVLCEGPYIDLDAAMTLPSGIGMPSFNQLILSEPHTSDQ